MPMTFDGLIIDFDGVLIDSEYLENQHLAEYLTSIGHPTTAEDTFTHFIGLSGRQFLDAVERWIGRTVPDEFHGMRASYWQRAKAQRIEAVAGAVAFLEALSPELPKAIASSSKCEWIRSHLGHLGLSHHFEGRIFSGQEQVAHGKPAPDIYLHAADALQVDIRRTLVIEDSSIGVEGAVAAGATVVGLCAGLHCLPGHADQLLARGAHHIAHDFGEVAALLG
jgi:HAD superfamily hydrolase (TIGR01509 family)